MSYTTAKAAIQERERLARARQQQQAREAAHAASSSSTNSNGKRPLTAIPADSTSPTAPNKRTHPSARPPIIPPGSSKALQDALASGSGDSHGVKHFQGPDDNAPLKNMIGTYVESVSWWLERRFIADSYVITLRYDLATLKNSKGGFLLESEEDDPRRKREREMQELLKQKRLENAAKQGLKDPRE